MSAASKGKATSRQSLKRKNAARPGSLDWEVLNEELPMGPRSVADLYAPLMSSNQGILSLWASLKRTCCVA